MEGLIEFLRGPFFRFTFSIMILGMMRILLLSVINGLNAKKKSKDKSIPISYVKKLTIGFVFPLRSLRVKPFYSIISVTFHIGLIITPLLLFDHALLIENSIGFSWIGISIPKMMADNLSLITIIAGILLLIIRISNKASRFISRKQDYLLPVLLIIPFVSGYLCANYTMSTDIYNLFMIIHIFSGCLIFLLIPFTKIAHCVLLPLSQWITARTWKFVPEAGEEVLLALDKEGEKL